MKYIRNFLVAAGMLALLASGFFVAVDWGPRWFIRSMQEKTPLQELINGDGSAKATLYRIDSGAAAATRTYVTLSNAKVDGSKEGFVVLSLLRAEGAGRPALEWKADRLLVIHYPAQAEVEYSVSKTRGITVELKPE
jgi:hypothetical protein